MSEIELTVYRNENGRREEIHVLPGHWVADAWPAAWSSHDVKMVSDGLLKKDQDLAAVAVDRIEGLIIHSECSIQAWARLKIAALLLVLKASDKAELAIRTALNGGCTEAERIGFGFLASRFYSEKRLLKLALNEAEKIEEACEASHCLDSMVIAYVLRTKWALVYEIGRMDAALEIAERALALFNKLTPGQLAEADALSAVGLTLTKLGRLDQALNLQMEALEIVKRREPNSMNEAEVINNIALVHYMMRKYGAAAGAIEESLKIKRRWPSKEIEIATALNNLANIRISAGEYDLAAVNLNEALEIRRRLVPNSGQLATTLNNLGALEKVRFDLVKAEEYFVESLEIWRNIGDEDNLEAAAVLGNLGEVYLRTDRIDQALDYRSRQLAKYKKISPNSEEIPQLMVSVSSILVKQGNLVEARRIIDDSVVLWKQIKPNEDLPGNILGAYASLEAKEGNLAEAEAMYKETIMAFEKSELANVELLNVLIFYAEFLTYQMSGRDELALSTIMRAIGISSRIIDSFGMTGERRSYFRSTFGRCYRLLMELYLRKGQPELAFEAIESFRGIEVASQWSKSASEDLSNELAQISGVITGGSSLKIGEMQARIDEDDAIVSYAFSREKIVLFFVRKRVFEMSYLGIGREQLRDQIEELHQFISRDGVMGARFGDEVRERGRSLGKVLIDPIAKHLDGVNDILVITDGVVNRVPFAALVTDNGSYLCERASLHIASAVNVGLMTSGTSTAHAGLSGARASVFGDVLISQSTQQPMQTTERKDSASELLYSRLPFSRNEALALAAMFEDIQINLGDSATEEAVRSSANKSAYLHFGTHAQLNLEAPLESALVLARPSVVTSGTNDGLLKAREIMELDLDSRLVFLAACGAALGSERFGEGLLGLTLAFQLAGARGVVAALWNVDDQGSSDFVTRFYSYLKEGLSRSQALRATQLDFLKSAGERDGRLRSPYYWAGFQLYGEWH